LIVNKPYRTFNCKSKSLNIKCKSSVCVDLIFKVLFIKNKTSFEKNLFWVVKSLPSQLYYLLISDYVQLLRYICTKIKNIQIKAKQSKLDLHANVSYVNLYIYFSSSPNCLPNKFLVLKYSLKLNKNSNITILN